jgi:hypothetical protein
MERNGSLKESRVSSVSELLRIKSYFKKGSGLVYLFVVMVLVLSLPSYGSVGVQRQAVSQTFKLTSAERKLVDAVARGEGVSFMTGDPARDDPAHGSSWSEGRTLRAKVIKDLVTGANWATKVRSAGVVIFGARIVGRLDFNNAHLQFPLKLEHCLLIEPIVLYGARSESISLAGSYIAGTIKGLQIAFPEERISVWAQGVRVDGNLILNSGFSGKGKVDLVQARIGGILDCNSSTIANPGGYAIDASLAQIGDGVSLANLKAKGSISFAEAKIGGNLLAKGATIDNHDGVAFTAERAKIGGDVWLNSDFTANGKVSLEGAEIAGNLDCGKGNFRAGRDGSALDLLQAKIAGALSLWDVVIDGDLALAYAHVGVLLDNSDSWPLPGTLKLDGFVYGEIAPTAPTDADSRIKWLGLQGTEVFRSQPYEQLAKVLRANGDDAGAKKVFIAKENSVSRLASLGIFQRAWNCVLFLTIGYGYYPWRAVWFIGGFVGLGAVLFRGGYKKGLMIPAEEGAIAQWLPFNSIVFSLETFLPLVELRQARHWTPAAQKGLSGRMLRVYLWVHIMLGWFFASMLVAGITGLVRGG